MVATDPSCWPGSRSVCASAADRAWKNRPAHDRRDGVLLGALRNSVKHRVLKRGNDLVLQVGAFTKYARRHELGDHPYLRTTIRKNARALRRAAFPKQRKAKR